MNQARRRVLEPLIVQRIALAMKDALQQNLAQSIGADDAPLAPLNVWDRAMFRSYEDGRRREKSPDRSNSDTPLVDTGRLLNSISVSTVDGKAGTSDGRPGRSYNIEIVAADYGLEQARGGTFHNVVLGRTKAIRESRSFEGREGYDYVVLPSLKVPARPWNQVSRVRLQNLANDAVNSITGA